MQYRIYHNPSARFMRPFTDGDIVIEGYKGDIDIEDDGTAEGDLRTCEAIYSRHNRDDRPDGQTAPSLSIGDVVILRNRAAYSVDTCGFIRADFIQVGRVERGPYSLVAQRVYEQVLALEQERDRKFP